MTDQAPHPPPFQFTLRQLLGATSVCCVAAALIYWLELGPAILVFLFLSIIGVAVFFATRRQFTECAFTLLFGFLLIALLLPTLSSARGSTSRSGFCLNNMRNIAQALKQYELVNGTLPPAYIADENGKPMHSWRVLILPYIERQDLYEKYRFDEPWDGPNNSQLHNHRVHLFECPSDDHTMNNTSYIAVTGAKTIWPNEKTTKFSDVKDGLGNTILLVEVRDSGIHWMEPRDLDITQMPMAINSDKGLSISSSHETLAFANVMFADGKPRRIPNTASTKALRAALTISGGEKERLPIVKDPQ
jgi:hypothetical protein